MKKALFFLLSICCLWQIKAQTVTPISKEEALEIVRAKFPGQDVDYYISSDYFAYGWTVFVDAEPMKGWEHDCYICRFPNTRPQPSYVPSVSITQLKMPPTTGTFEPLEVKNRYGVTSTVKPRVVKKLI